MMLLALFFTVAIADDPEENGECDNGPWSVCGGLNFPVAQSCCPVGFWCYQYDDFYSQCINSGPQPGTPSPDALEDALAVPSPANAECENAPWDVCGGLNFPNISTCCPVGYTCYKDSEYHSQCRNDGCPEGWDCETESPSQTTDSTSANAPAPSPDSMTEPATAPPPAGNPSRATAVWGLDTEMWTQPEKGICNFDGVDDVASPSMYRVKIELEDCLEYCKSNPDCTAVSYLPAEVRHSRGGECSVFTTPFQGTLTTGTYNNRLGHLCYRKRAFVPWMGSSY